MGFGGFGHLRTQTLDLVQLCFGPEKVNLWRGADAHVVYCILYVLRLWSLVRARKQGLGQVTSNLHVLSL